MKKTIIEIIKIFIVISIIIGLAIFVDKMKTKGQDREILNSGLVVRNNKSYEQIDLRIYISVDSLESIDKKDYHKSYYQILSETIAQTDNELRKEYLKRKSKESVDRITNKMTYITAQEYHEKYKDVRQILYYIDLYLKDKINKDECLSLIRGRLEVAKMRELSK